MLINRLVCGINNNLIQGHLLSAAEEEWMLMRATDLAMCVGTAVKDVAGRGDLSKEFTLNGFDVVMVMRLLTADS